MSDSKVITSTTQEYLDIFDITNDLVITKRGSASMIISVMAMNFDLLAEPEQDAMIYGYAGLLNSLNYPIQILIRSQPKDVSAYVNLLRIKEEETMNRLRRDQIRKYREFVGDLVQERNVLDKKFFVVIPASPIELGVVSPQSVVPGIKSTTPASFDRTYVIERARNILEPRRDHLVAQFSRLGLAAFQVPTQEMIQLFYSMYNAESTEGQKMADSKSYTSAMVEGTTTDSIFGGPSHHFVANQIEANRARNATTDDGSTGITPPEVTDSTTPATVPITTAIPTMSPPAPLPAQAFSDSTMSFSANSVPTDPTQAYPPTSISNPSITTPPNTEPTLPPVAEIT